MDGGGCRQCSRRTGYPGLEGCVAHLHFIVKSIPSSEATA
jgi:hypothetical protein